MSRRKKTATKLKKLEEELREELAVVNKRVRKAFGVVGLDQSDLEVPPEKLRVLRRFKSSLTPKMRAYLRIKYPEAEIIPDGGNCVIDCRTQKQ